MGEKPSSCFWTEEQKAIVLERLTIGRDRIKRGWCKGQYHKDTVERQVLSYCMLGAILDQNDLLDHTTRRASVLLIESIDSIHGKFVYDDIVSFNDDPKRKKEEVLRVFGNAIERVK